MVTSQAEQQALSPKITQFTWIGLHRDPKDISRWLWIDGTRPTYTNWNTGAQRPTRALWRNLDFRVQVEME